MFVDAQLGGTDTADRVHQRGDRERQPRRDRVQHAAERGSRDADHGIAPLIEALRLRIFAGRYDRAQHRVGRVGE